MVITIVGGQPVPADPPAKKHRIRRTRRTTVPKKARKLTAAAQVARTQSFESIRRQKRLDRARAAARKNPPPAGQELRHGQDPPLAPARKFKAGRMHSTEAADSRPGPTRDQILSETFRGSHFPEIVLSQALRGAGRRLRTLSPTEPPLYHVYIVGDS